ncbi:MAG: AEC family transporter [Alphaproteobacteria bacterium]|nr:AEC family transporter [Alphaproteobacteria bacterium]
MQTPWPLLAPILAALFPVFALFALGNLLRRRGVIIESVWGGIDRLVFWVLFPCFLFYRTLHADLSGALVGPIAVVLIGVILIGAVAARLLKPALGLPAESHVAVYQAAFRINVYIAIAVSEALLGAEGVVIAAIATAVTAPVMNAVALVELVRLGPAPSGAVLQSPAARIIIGFMRNPLILATLAGAALNALDAPPPAVLDETIRIASQAALPLALLGVGAGLRLKTLRTAGAPTAVAAALKLIFAPLAALALALAVGLEGAAAFIAVLFAAMPTSASSYQMTKAMGGDASLMAAIITSQTLLTAVTAPIVLVIAALILLPGGFAPG